MKTQMKMMKVAMVMAMKMSKIRMTMKMVMKIKLGKVMTMQMKNENANDDESDDDDDDDYDMRAFRTSLAAQCDPHYCQTLATCSISSKTQAKTVIPSWVHLDPVQPLSKADKASVALAHCHIPIAYCAILAVRLAVS